MTTSGRAPPGWASSKNRPRRSSQSRSTRAPVAEGRPSACSESDHIVFTRVSQSTGPPRSRIRRASQPSRRLRSDQQREAEPAVGTPSPDPLELWRGVEAGLVGLDDPKQPVALEVAVGGEPVHAGPRSAAPRPARRRRSSRPRPAAAAGSSRSAGAARGDVVEEERSGRPAGARRSCGRGSRPAAARRAGSPARPASGRVEVAPDDRREAGVPVPLPRIAAGLGRCRRSARPRARPPASSPRSTRSASASAQRCPRFGRQIILVRSRSCACGASRAEKERRGPRASRSAPAARARFQPS